MSTTCKVIIESTDINSVTEICQDYLKITDSFEVLTEESKNYPDMHDLFMNNENKATHLFLAEYDSFIDIHYNSFSECADLASTLSQKIKARVIVLIYQSTAEAGYLAIYEDGSNIRDISYADGEVTNENGNKLPFESNQLETKIEDGDEVFYSFGCDEIEDYLDKLKCHSSTYNDDPASWIHIYRKNKASDKPWWKFWA